MADNNSPNPEDIDPVPPYRQSLSSTASAPTYASDRPSYHSERQRPAQTAERRRLDASQTAQTGTLSASRRNPNTNPQPRWDPLSIDPERFTYRGSLDYAVNMPQYENIIRRRRERRASAQRLIADLIIRADEPQPTVPERPRGPRATQGSPASASIDFTTLRPLYPPTARRTRMEEDPDIVGEVEAERAREERVRKEREERERESVARQSQDRRNENRAWDFYSEHQRAAETRRSAVTPAVQETQRKSPGFWQKVGKDLKGIFKSKSKRKPD
ncbi:MAG: hypothetical protein M1822_004901 [Bathelium mastoideum]|nr:MAG: hypothetical protein M1822_004901 [Bathelium mastoideum]